MRDDLVPAVADGDLWQQRIGQVTGHERGEPARVDDEHGTLREHPARRHGDMGADRHVDGRPEECYRSAVAVSGVRGEQAGQQCEAFSLVDGVVEAHGEVMSQPDES